MADDKPHSEPGTATGTEVAIVPAAARVVKQRPKSPNAMYITKVRGRDGSLTYQLKPEGYEAIRVASANGKDLASIARQVLNISPEAFVDMRKRDVYARECVEVGRALMSDELHDILMRQARDGVTVAAIFLARSRAGWNNDAGAIEGMPAKTVNVQQNISINLVEPMTPEQLRALTQPPVKVIENDAAD